MNNHNSANDCQVVQLSSIDNQAGKITVIENGQQLAFNVKRVYYLYDVPGGAERGGHAHKSLYQLIVAASGSFDVVLNDGQTQMIIHLNSPNKGLLIKPGIWRELNSFSSGSICLVLASELYNENDYIRNYQEFKIWKKNENLQ